MPGLLLGPYDDPIFIDRFLQASVEAGHWKLFGAATPSWQAALDDWDELPDALLVNPAYASPPEWVWSVPVPVVLLAGDPNLLWHGYRHLLPLADLILTDAPSAARMRRLGVEHVRAANLYGLDRHFAAAVDQPDGKRDIDVVFVGNFHPAIQGERLSWLGRVAALADQYKVVVTTGVHGADYRALLRRSKLVFNRAIRGECNLRALEAAASGAVLLQETENQEVREYLQPNSEYAPYTTDDLEHVIERLLANEEERVAIAKAARDQARWWTYEAFIHVALAAGGKGWSEVKERARERTRRTVKVPLAGRVWQRASLCNPDTDHTLIADLTAAHERRSLGVLAQTPEEAQTHLAAASRGNRVSAVGHAIVLTQLGRTDEAVAQLGQVLAALETQPELCTQEADSVPYPVRFDWLRVGWEEAGYAYPDDPTTERREKARLLRARALALRGERTGAESDWRAAVECCPEWPHLRVGLGSALLRVGRPSDAVEHFRFAVERNPFDNAAAQALVESLVATGQVDEADCVRAHRRVLATAAPNLVADVRPSPVPAAIPPATSLPTEPVQPIAETLSLILEPISVAAPAPRERPATPLTPLPAPSAPTPRTSRPSRPQTRFVDLSRESFHTRFGNPDTSTALSGFTPPVDTRMVLTLLAHAQPRRVLEIGTAAGHMTANLTALTPPDAVVYSLGIVAEEVPSAKPEGFRPQSGTPHQDYEVPKRDQFARFVNHFGTARKAMLVTADSRTYDFTRLAPLDFAFVDGGHDLATARSDSLASYQALRPGGVLVWHDVPSPTPWVEVEAAITSLAFPEAVYKVAGTQVAFLIKGEGLGAVADATSGRVAVIWDGAVDALHSLAHVNRSVCGELVTRGHNVALAVQPPNSVPASPLPVPSALAPLVGRDLPGAVHVRHRWPPDFTPPPGNGAFVLIQPWEFGRIPRAWVEPILSTVDELWCYSRSVLRAFVASGVPESRLALVPPGVDPDHFHPGIEPLPLATGKKLKFLFVGGTIERKGFDVLLAAYRRAFTRADDVCLVVKDMGVGTFYRNQTAEHAIRAIQNDLAAPEIIYLTDDLTEEELARLYATADVLVHPYRGEGFGLPVLEAMACGKPVVVTAGGPTDEFVPQSAGWRVPARLRYFDNETLSGQPTAGRPWWLEPDADALVAILKEVATNSAERSRRGEVARRAALAFTWARTASVIEDRIRVLRTRTPVRFARRTYATQTLRPITPARADSLSAPAAFAPAVTLRADDPLIVPAAPIPRVTIPAVVGKPRVSLTMIVKNEERNLPECLTSVRDLVDEAVVVDTGSTDRTRDIAQSFGCVLGEFPWVDHFAAARNAALEKATGDYAFWMDADDRLDEDNRRKLKALFESLPSSNAAFVIKCLCVGDGTTASAAGTAVDHVRLFRLHPAHRWTYRVHEQILPSLRATGADVQWSEVYVWHVGYIDPSVRRRKLDRDLRLLKLDEDERPDDPFTLFNLGSVYHELGNFPAAAKALEGSLAGSHPKDSIVRKTYALLARCHHQGGDARKAEATCRRGRTHYPDDAELLFLSAGLARELGDPSVAEGLYRKLIDGTEGPHFASVDTSLRAVKGRHNLAVMFLEQGRLPEAEGVWRAALTHDPYFFPAQVGLGEVCIKANNSTGVERQIVALESLGEAGAAEAAVLSARWKTAQGDHPGAVAVLEAAITRMPQAFGMRVALSHIHIAAESPPEVLESSFKGILELDPHNAQAKRNLEVLYRKTGRWVEGILDGTESTPPA
jgi:glycosyltransferase involved in cell wall biosynthesis/predicted Zn-dependent protease/predicted O-methyltransferase YrrM